MGITAAGIGTVLKALGSVAASAGPAYQAKQSRAQKGESQAAQKKAAAVAKKKKDLLARGKVKTPATRLLGGKPSLG
jgi:membrane protease subunit (stomatin/prohibitin family)